MATRKKKVPRPKGPIDWELLRHEYEGDDLTLEAIRKKHKITRRVLSRQAEARGWTLRRPRLTGAEKLKALVDKHIAKLEQEFKDGKSRKTSEAQLNRLAALGRTLENIARLEKATGEREEGSDVDTAITDERRRELARRLGALGRASGFARAVEGAA